MPTAAKAACVRRFSTPAPRHFITFDGVVTPIDLTSGQLTIERDLTIVGPGAYTLTVQRASGVFRIFAVTPGTTAIIEGLTIANGLLPQDVEEGGAGVFNDGGTLTVRNAVLRGGTAWVGGAIFSTGHPFQPASLTVVDALLTGNTALAGGAIVTFADDGGGSIRFDHQFHAQRQQRRDLRRGHCHDRERRGHQQSVDDQLHGQRQQSPRRRAASTCAAT